MLQIQKMFVTRYTKILYKLVYTNVGFGLFLPFYFLEVHNQVIYLTSFHCFDFLLLLFVLICYKLYPQCCFQHITFAMLSFYLTCLKNFYIFIFNFFIVPLVIQEHIKFHVFAQFPELCLLQISQFYSAVVRKHN